MGRKNARKGVARLFNRVDKLRKRLAEKQIDGILITSPHNRRYVTGFTGSAGYVLITDKVATLIADFRYTEQAKQQAPHFEIVFDPASILQGAAEQVKKQGIKRLAFEAKHVTYSLYEALGKLLPGTELVPAADIVESLRGVKDESEIAMIRKAAEIADAAFAHMLGFIRPGLTEREVELELEFHMRRLGASAAAFETIVASGVRSSMPHGLASDKVIEKGDLVTLDFGAYYQGYCSDITRTVAVGEPDPKLKEIYEVVRQAQLQGVTHLKAGMTGIEADALTRDVIKAAGYGEFFGHSTGHGIGLEVHELPALSQRGSEVLHSGMVVTVEPGIYIAGLGGVRIEDDVIITETGCEILTTSPKELIIL